MDLNCLNKMLLLMQNTFLKTFLMVCCTLIVGCVPTVHTFFEPASKTGKVEQQYCRGHVGPRNTIKFQSADLTLSIYTQKEEKQILLIYISVDPSKEAALHFHSQDFEVRVGERVSKVHPTKVIGFNYRPFNAQKSVELEQWETLAGGDYDIYFMELYFAIGERSQFELQFPPMKVNQTTLNIPSIKFMKKTEFFIDAINC